VLTCVQHPNADKLRCTTVDVGGPAALPIVCGAPNVAVGQTVAVATVGCTLRAADGKEFAIKPAKLRGEPSQGMICAEDELGLGTSHDGIMVLDAALVPGTPLARVLGGGDEVFTVENHALTHRADLWGQLGWAREMAAALGLDAPAAPDLTWNDAPAGWTATIADDGCSTWCGAVVTGVANGESPEWLRRRLEACGLRPLGLLVDVTNYVMLELGEPMHAFDRRDIAGQAITVRSAAAGEPFTTLDGKAHTLAAGDLLIADAARPLALAGIMGGQGSMVRADTSEIVLEAAVFKADRIRRTRLRTGISTDSSARFEKGQRPEAAAAAINRAVALLAQLCPGCTVTARFHAGTRVGEARSAPFQPAAVGRLTGLDVPAAEQQAILARLGFAVEGDTVRIPWWRAKDCQGVADLVEEVARHHGYERIAPQVPRLSAAVPAANPLRDAEHRARRVLAGAGWDEVQTYAFTSTAWADALEWPAAQRIALAHPLSSEQTVMRLSLLPTLLEAVGRNRRHFDAVRIYEVGKRYGVGVGAGATPDETIVVSGVCAAAGDEAPFYAARDAALTLLAGLGHAATATVRTAPCAGFLGSRLVDLWIGKRQVGVVGEVAAAFRTQAGCPERVGAFSVDLEALIGAFGAAKPIAHSMPSRFQATVREFTFAAAEAVAYGDIAAAANQAAGELAAGVTLKDVYRGAPYSAGTKAVSIAVTLQSDERTLADADLAKVSARIPEAVARRTGATLVGKAG
jgi:phenylalanyl-tRNA synthetase beta chain